MISHLLKKSTRHVIALGALALLLNGCIGLMPSPFRPFPGPAKTPQLEDLAQAFDIVCRNYRLGPDDILSVNFQADWSIPAGSYKLDSLDQIDIEFVLDPELNRKVVIRPDGMITIPGVGDIKAVGMAPEELARRIEERCRKANILRNSTQEGKSRDYRAVTVSVDQFYQKVDRLVKSLTNLTQGQQTNVTVKPDGTIDLPLMKERILAAGYTVGDVERTVNRVYRGGELNHVVASVGLVNAKSRKVYILGEVNRPGAYEIRQPITAMQALALAEGHKTGSADLTSVILVSKDAHGKPIGRRLDLKRTLDVGDMSSAILVKPYDVLFVPKTYIRDLGLFMEQYLASAAQVGLFVDLVKDIGNR